jgi:hypothetical protein
MKRKKITLLVKEDEDIGVIYLQKIIEIFQNKKSISIRIVSFDQSFNSTITGK